MSETDEEADYQTVATKVAEVTLESDSLPETPNARKVRRRRKAKSRPKQMEVDPPVLLGPPRDVRRSHDLGSQMDWQVEESDIYSSDSASERNQDADDEQSDWVGYVVEHDEVDLVGTSSASLERRRRIGKPSTAMSVIQSKLEKFSKDPGCSELSIDIRVKERTQTAQFSRFLQLYKLEVIRRQRGTVVLRKRRPPNPPVPPLTPTST
ncbi:unnamed protein product, partial [Mesorhabditis belari]|uniref:Uncharacterized protein n=1 Tax=Mesorhabditis belari TaxID=2138241 RepID=A0AAF3FEJ9_9BILA